MKIAFPIVAATLFAVSIGCDEAQYNDAVEERNDAAAEFREDYTDATADGIVTYDEADEVADEAEDFNESVNEVAEERADLIQERND